MERLTVDGGEQWLGFARNRVKALKRAGTRYTRQSFEMPDGSRVIIELAGRDHTIRLTGSFGVVISGVVRDGILIEKPSSRGEPKRVLRSFKATADAAKKVLQKPNAALNFYDTAFLATPLANKNNLSCPSKEPSQPGSIFASMYSGKMCSAIQILLGRKKQVHITYTYDFYDTYGIHTAADNSLWLVRISKDHGVLAMPFEIEGLKVASKVCDADNESYKIFKGLPTGRDFPADLDDAIEEKRVLRLMRKDTLAEFYELYPYFFECGWSFNAQGTEAHNTAWGPVTMSQLTPRTPGADFSPGLNACHYSIEIQISSGVNGGVATGIAKLTKISSNPLRTTQCFIPTAPASTQPERIPFTSASFRADALILSDLNIANLVAQSWTQAEDEIIKESMGGKRGTGYGTSAPITLLVGHRDDGSLFKIGYRVIRKLICHSPKHYDGTIQHQILVDDLPWPQEYWNNHPTLKFPVAPVAGPLYLAVADSYVVTLRDPKYVDNGDGTGTFVTEERQEKVEGWIEVDEAVARGFWARGRQSGWTAPTCANVAGVRNGFLMVFSTGSYRIERPTRYKVPASAESTRIQPEYYHYYFDMSSPADAVRSDWYLNCHPPALLGELNEGSGFGEMIATDSYRQSFRWSNDYPGDSLNMGRLNHCYGGISCLGDPLAWMHASIAVLLHRDRSFRSTEWRGLRAFSGSKGLTGYDAPKSIFETTEIPPEYNFIGYTTSLDPQPP